MKNQTYKRAALSKLALLIALLFLATAILALGYETLTPLAGNASRQITLNLRYKPRDVFTPQPLSNPKISPAELYARLLDEARIPWSEPAILKENKR